VPLRQLEEDYIMNEPTKLTTEQLKRQAVFRIVVFFGIVITLAIYISSQQIGSY